MIKFFMTEIEFNIQDVSEYSIASIGGTGYGNTGAFKLNTKLIVIDTTLYKTSAEQFKKLVEEKFLVKVSHVIYTHYHGDHTFGSASFKNATIISSKDTSINLKKGHQNDWKKGLEEEDPLVSEPIEILQPKITFEDTYIITEGYIEMEIRKLGGHTSGSSIIYFPNAKILFSGDLIFNYCFPYGADPTCDLDLWIKALNTIKSYDAQKIIPGHGPVIDNKHDLDPHIKFFEYAKATIMEGIEDMKTWQDVNQLIEIPEIFFDSAERRKEFSIEQWYKTFKSKLNTIQ